jgi:aminopeptidase N
MRDDSTAAIRRGDYAAPAFWIREVELEFDPGLSSTRVVSRMRVERNSKVPAETVNGGRWPALAQSIT